MSAANNWLWSTREGPTPDARVIVLEAGGARLHKCVDMRLLLEHDELGFEQAAWAQIALMADQMQLYLDSGL